MVQLNTKVFYRNYIKGSSVGLGQVNEVAKQLVQPNRSHIRNTVAGGTGLQIKGYV